MQFGVSYCTWDKKLPEPTHGTDYASLNQNPSSFASLWGAILAPRYDYYFYAI